MAARLKTIIPDCDGKTGGELLEILAQKGYDRQTSVELIDELFNDYTGYITPEKGTTWVSDPSPRW